MAFPDAVALVITYLEGIVDPVPVVGRVPDTVPDEFIQVRLVGGPAVVPVRTIARLDLFAWSTSDPAATALANTARAAMWALGGTNVLGVPVYAVAESKGLSTLDDPLTGKPRGWMTFDLTIRADEVVSYN